MDVEYPPSPAFGVTAANAMCTPTETKLKTAKNKTNNKGHTGINHNASFRNLYLQMSNGIDALKITKSQSFRTPKSSASSFSLAKQKEHPETIASDGL